MGWKDIAKVASDWADAKKTELLTTDRRTRENAAADADTAGSRAGEEAVTSFLEAALPKPWADRVTAARPENVAAREAEEARQEDAQRRETLAGQDPADVSLTVSGAESGSVTLALPCTRTEEHPTREDDPDDGPAPLSWLRVVVEAPDAVPLGSTTLGRLAIAVPAYAGPGRYDLIDLAERGERGEIDWWEVFDIHLDPTNAGDDSTWYLDVSAGGGAPVDVTDTGVAFDLPMTSAISSVRVRGTITW